MQQPALTWHVIIAIACSESDVRHLQLHLLIPVEGGMLSHPRCCQEETACGEALDIALREGGGIGEPAAVEDIEGIQVERLHLQHTVRQFDAFHALMVMPARFVAFWGECHYKLEK